MSLYQRSMNDCREQFPQGKLIGRDNQELPFSGTANQPDSESGRELGIALSGHAKWEPGARNARGERAS